jgi:DNA-binding NarL/FixJ family response regulator
MRLPIRSTSGRRRDVSVALQRFEAAPGRPLFVVTFTGSDLDDTLEPHARAFGMTPREVEVVRHVAQGASNCEIAHSLSLSVRTIESPMIDIQ